MILTGVEIAKQISDGEIIFDPFDVSSLNPNSCNYHLGSELRTPRSSSNVLDPYKTGDFDWITRSIPPEGLVLEPGHLYLATTRERIGSESFIPSLIGRSSIGRLGLYLQVSADLGNLGSIHRWTLELVAVQPVRIYANMKIGQVSFWKPEGEVMMYGGYFGRFSFPQVTPERFNIR